MSTPPKRLARVLTPPPSHWVGDGFPVRSIFSYAREAERWSPFVLLDYMGPMEFEPTNDRRGVGPHPHRGIETVTVLFAGEVEHRDSVGNHGRLGAGDVQWMTAGGGILHEELQGEAFSKRGGLLHGVQLWVNLPASDKMTPPRYQDLASARFPEVHVEGGGTARVIAGELKGAFGPAHPVTAVELWDVTIAKGGSIELSMPDGHTALLLVVGGPVTIDGTEVHSAHVAELTRTGSTFRLDAPDGGKVLVMGGRPLGEPIVGHGPFVMNTWDEISRAIHDFDAGRFGTLRGTMDGGTPDRAE